ncbi:hypothetical protein IFM89_036883, partial [Coptis chinensis]
VCAGLFGSSSHPQLVILVAQDEISSSSGQVEPPGMHMIYLPYSDDVRHIEEEEADALSSKTESDAAKKRKAIHENAAKESEQYDWAKLADSGKLKDLTVVELKYYLTAHSLPLTGKKEFLISRILTHLGK